MSRPYHEGEITALSEAIRKSPRPMVLSLSPGATPIEKAEHVKTHANLWRISPDFWDLWRLLDRQFELCRSSRNREVLAEGKAIAWAAEAADGGTYLALFNRGEAMAPLEVPLAKLGLTGTVRVRDLWKRAPRGAATGAVRADVEPHGAVLLKLTPER
jgi:hypothetical protein